MGLFESYLRGEASAFFPSHPGSAAERRRAVARAARPLAPAVADELERQNTRWAASPARDANLARLRKGAAAVVTGQQVGLFLGPLYTLYKAAAAVRDAQALEAETGTPVVPVFWLQTEDHDLPEIAGCSMPTPGGALLELALPASADERISIAHRTLPPEVDALVERMRDELGELPHGEAHVDRLARHYRAGARWSDAFAGVLAELFADEGLVLVDPRTPALAAAAAQVHRHALEGAETLAAALGDRCARLRAAGFPVAVHVREGAPLSFFHSQGPEGPRFRLDASLAEVGGGRRHTRASLLAALDAEPLAFSTSALLRPIVQDTLLPTATYVGGPGEIAYFAQLSPLYAAFDLPMPVVAPRARFRVIEPRTRRLLAKLGLQADDAAKSEEQLLACRDCACSDTPAADILRRQLLGALEAKLDEIGAGVLGAELEKPLARTRTSVRVAVDRFASRYEAARLRVDAALVDDVRRLKRLLHPGAPQERVHALPYYGARYGDRAFVETVLRAARPFDAALGDLEP